MYALKLLRSKGLMVPALWDVAFQTLVARMLYASQVWWGFVNNASQQRLNAIIKRLIKQSFLPKNHQSFNELCEKSDLNLFKAVLDNEHHILHHLLSPIKIAHHDLRPRAHNRVLPKAFNVRQKSMFFNRMLFSKMY